MELRNPKRQPSQLQELGSQVGHTSPGPPRAPCALSHAPQTPAPPACSARSLLCVSHCCLRLRLHQGPGWKLPSPTLRSLRLWPGHPGLCLRHHLLPSSLGKNEEAKAVSLDDGDAADPGGHRPRRPHFRARTGGWSKGGAGPRAGQLLHLTTASYLVPTLNPRLSGGWEEAWPRGPRRGRGGPHLSPPVSNRSPPQVP